ncbi:MAG: LysM peptidoglycan-binding domain-containing protein [Planctomycetes bacterium]|nr:LysM peptidoglycan-binding domain-containing protein [Planctomycetota bacterium]
MGKYVAVGVLAVIVLAAVTYEAPKEGAAATAPGEGVRVEGSFGPASPQVASAPAAEPAPIATSTPIAAEPTPAPAPTPQITATTQVASAAKEELRHTVKSGETLSDVAQALLGDRGRWKELYEANKDKLSSPDHVRAGLTLIFPAADVNRTRPASAPRQATTTTATTPPAGGKTYTVAKGDTLYSIARRELGNGNRWREIKTLNQLSSDNVVVGATLVLPPK